MKTAISIAAAILLLMTAQAASGVTGGLHIPEEQGQEDRAEELEAIRTALDSLAARNSSYSKPIDISVTDFSQHDSGVYRKPVVFI